MPAKTSKKTKKVKNIEPQILMPIDHELKDQDVGETSEAKSNKFLRYSDKDLTTFRSVIEMNKIEAIDELRMLKERLYDLTKNTSIEDTMVYSDHMGEQGSEALEKEKTYAQVQRITEYIQKLNEALVRIENKTYGICRVCNCLIAKERLLAVPITTLSASYKIHQKCPSDGIDKIEKIEKIDSFN